MSCGRKRQLLMDYLERVQAFAVELELHLKAGEAQAAGADTGESFFRVEHAPREVKIVMIHDAQGDGWLLVQEARIQCEIARLAFETHTTSHRC